MNSFATYKRLCAILYNAKSRTVDAYTHDVSVISQLLNSFVIALLLTYM